jgi:hypothetical protein
VTVAYGPAVPRPPCTVCGTPAEKHGTYPTCATHPYTGSDQCGHVIGARCVGAECRNGCVRARGVAVPRGPLEQAAAGMQALEAGHDPLCMAVLRGKECTCGVLASPNDQPKEPK